MISSGFPASRAFLSCTAFSRSRSPAETSLRERNLGLAATACMASFLPSWDSSSEVAASPRKSCPEDEARETSAATVPQPGPSELWT